MDEKKKKVIVIGAGPGGLASAMILAHRGYEVTVYEKQPHVGGRTSCLEVGDFRFELGPTFVMLPEIFEEVFALSGKKFAEYVQWTRLETMYRLRYGDGRDFHVFFDKDKLREEIARVFPGDEKGYDCYLVEQKRKFDLMYPCLKVPYHRWYHYLRWKLIKAFPYMDNFVSVHDVLGRYFRHEDMKISMSFQSKYLGMSPWSCPGAFTILSYVEHAFGIYHPQGGVHKIPEAMAKVAEENGARIVLGKGISKLLIEDGRATGVVFPDGGIDRADFVVMNADFAKGMTDLVPDDTRSRWSHRRLAKRPYSCSTFMLYLGLDKKYDIPHHNIVFAGDYRRNVEEIFENGSLPQDPSIYIQNASATDASLAPEGKSTLYVLVPVPNLDTPIDWDKEKAAYRDLVLAKIAEKTELTDIAAHIEVERVITPADWDRQADVYKGAVFNLAHTLRQMLYLRPHNRFENIPGLYIVGGGTHPGSGLPTILESGRIAADLIHESD